MLFDAIKAICEFPLLQDMGGGFMGDGIKQFLSKAEVTNLPKVVNSTFRDALNQAVAEGKHPQGATQQILDVFQHKKQEIYPWLLDAIRRAGDGDLQQQLLDHFLYDVSYYGDAPGSVHLEPDLLSQVLADTLPRFDALLAQRLSEKHGNYILLLEIGRLRRQMPDPD
jgi:hypothetical protein